MVPLDAHVTVAIAAYDPQADVNARRASPSARLAPLRDLDREGAQEPPRRHRAAAGEGVGQLHLADAGEVERAPRGYDEILLVDEDGYVAEGPTTNVFLVDATACSHAARGEGAARRHAQLDPRARARRGLQVAEAQDPARGALEAAEVFLTGTTAGVWPIASVDDQALPAAPGPGERAARRALPRRHAARTPRSRTGSCRASRTAREDPLRHPALGRHCTSATTSARCASTSRCRKARRSTSSPTTTR